MAAIAGGVASPPIPSTLADTLAAISLFVFSSAKGKSAPSGFFNSAASLSHTPESSAICKNPDHTVYTTISVNESVRALFAPAVAAASTPSGFFTAKTASDIRQITPNKIFIVQVMTKNGFLCFTFCEFCGIMFERKIARGYYAG